MENLDLMTIGELYAFSEKNRNPELSVYARNRADAIAKRQAGQIQAALILDETCDRIYKQLPKELKW